MIQLPEDDEWELVNKIKISTHCGEAEINKYYKWKSENKQLSRYLNKKYNVNKDIIQSEHFAFHTALFMIANMAATHLKGEITEIHKRKPKKEDVVELVQSTLI